MASYNAFIPQGITSLVLASSSTASTPTAIASTAGTTTVAIGFQAVWINNPTTTPIYFSVGNSSAVLQAAVPTTAIACPGMCITNVSPRVVSVPPNCWISAATSAGSANLFVTPGFGD